jgi:hypothetical protein
MWTELLKFEVVSGDARLVTMLLKETIEAAGSYYSYYYFVLDDIQLWKGQPISIYCGCTLD